MDVKVALAVGQDAFVACELVGDFLNATVRPIVERRQNQNADRAFHAAVLRSVAWFRSIKKLGEPGDFQALHAAARALFELAVDLTLLVLDPNEYPTEKVYAWEELAKLHAADQVVKHFAASGRPVPPECSTQASFEASDGARIRARARAAFGTEGWNQRWTRHNLDTDARSADALAGGHFFGDFYRTRVPLLNWNTHGSGIAGAVNIPEEHFPGLGALALNDCAHLGERIGRMLLQRFGALDAIAEARLENLAKTRREHRVRVALELHRRGIHF